VTTTLRVALGERPIGFLTNLPDDRTIFAFDDEYRADPDRPVLSQSFLEDDGSLRADGPPVGRLAPPFFSNLLPEGGLRSIAARRLGISPDRDFPLLQHLGANLLGAVRLDPSDPLEALAPAGALAFALPGVQLKLSTLLDEDDALTVPAKHGGAEWIVKVASGKLRGLVENEYSMLAFARSVGIDVPAIKLVDPATIEGLPAEFDPTGPALAVRRFDRLDDGTRVHIEDFNQVFGQFPHDKYHHHTQSDIARLLNVRAGQSEARRFIERAVFTAAIANGDMHLKNWSLIYRDGRAPTLAPAYDYVSTLPYAVDHDLGLSFGGSKDRDVLSEERLRRFARGADLPFPFVRRTARAMAERILDAWPAFDGPLLPEHRVLLDTHIAKTMSGA